MIFNLKYPNEVKAAYAYLEKLEDNQSKVEIIKKSPIRSLAQNRYLYLCLGWFGCEYGCSIDEAKIDYFKRLCNRDIFERERVNKKGQAVKYLRSSAELSTTEMSLATERFRNWASMEAGIYIPAPNETQFLEFIQREIEKYKEFV